MYPSFSRFVADAPADDPLFSSVAAQFGMGRQRPGVTLGEEDGLLRVLVAADGRTALLPPDRVTAGLREEIVLGLMDSVEEAIEDARDRPDGDPDLVSRLEATLALLEHCFDDHEMRDM